MWIHFTGICGVISTGLAPAFKKLGHKVSGSDKGFFPPNSTYLSQHDIEVGPGFKAERLTGESGTHPDILVYNGLEGDSNPEIAEAKRLNIKLLTPAELISEYVVKPDASIVVSGSFGKTTITSLLVKIFKQAKKNISFMIGAMQADWSDAASVAADAEFSITEGDEYMVSLKKKSSKFFEYKPKYLIINAVKWEHHDMFPTFEEYVQNFAKLCATIPQDGLIVYNAHDQYTCEVVKHAKCRVVSYSIDAHNNFADPDWFLNSSTKPLTTFICKDIKRLEVIPFDRQVLGSYNDENFLAASVLAYELGIRKERIQEAIREFKGVKRRLEIVHSIDDNVVIDDFASSPSKVEGALQSIRERFGEHYVSVVFEPNTGSRTLASLSSYTNATFAKCDMLLLPRFTKLPKGDVERFGANELMQHVRKTLSNCQVIEDDKLLVKKLHDLTKQHPKCVVVFLGSHGFRGMITDLVSKLK